MNKDSSSNSRLDAQRAALQEPVDPLQGRGSKTRNLDFLETDILALLDKGVTYGQVALRLAKGGFHVSEHTIAAWRKKRRRKSAAASIAEGCAETPGAGAGDRIDGTGSTQDDGREVSAEARADKLDHISRRAGKDGNPFKRPKGNHP